MYQPFGITSPPFSRLVFLVLSGVSPPLFLALHIRYDPRLSGFHPLCTRSAVRRHKDLNLILPLFQLAPYCASAATGLACASSPRLLHWPNPLRLCRNPSFPCDREPQVVALDFSGSSVATAIPLFRDSLYSSVPCSASPRVIRPDLCSLFAHSSVESCPWIVLVHWPGDSPQSWRAWTGFESCLACVTHAIHNLLLCCSRPRFDTMRELHDPCHDLQPVPPVPASSPVCAKPLTTEWSALARRLALASLLWEFASRAFCTDDHMPLFAALIWMKRRVPEFVFLFGSVARGAFPLILVMPPPGISLPARTAESHYSLLCPSGLPWQSLTLRSPALGVFSSR